MARELTEKDLAYDRIAGTWKSFVGGYDTARRIEVLVGELSGADGIAGKSVLEGGCGLGHFTAALAARKPGSLVALDIAPKLVEAVAKAVPAADCRVGDILDLRSALGDATFDLVFSSEVIEHTPDPEHAVKELCARVAPGGLLVLSCPNRRWIWLLHLAQRLGLRRRYEGYENWVRAGDLTRWIREAGLEVEVAEGIHTVPWQFLPRALLRALDRRLRRRNYPVALNLAVRAVRPRR